MDRLRSPAPSELSNPQLGCAITRVEEVRGDDPELASYVRIDERELEAGG